MKIKKFKYYKHGGHGRSTSTASVGTYKSKKELLPGLNKTITKSVSALKTKKGGR